MKKYTRESEIKWMMEDPMGVAMEANEALLKDNYRLIHENHMLRRNVADQAIEIERLREEVKTAYDDYWGT